MSPEVAPGIADMPFQKTYRLAHSVSAIEALSSGPGGAGQLGLMTRLPEGAELDLRGPGFDDHTIRVRWADRAYFVFLEDLEPQKKRAASAVAAG